MRQSRIVLRRLPHTRGERGAPGGDEYLCVHGDKSDWERKSLGYRIRAGDGQKWTVKSGSSFELLILDSRGLWSVGSTDSVQRPCLSSLIVTDATPWI